MAKKPVFKTNRTYRPRSVEESMKIIRETNKEMEERIKRILSRI